MKIEYIPPPKSDVIEACLRTIEEVKRQINDAFAIDAKLLGKRDCPS